MNFDGMRRYAKSDIVDAVVIGTGAGGAPLLSRLAKAGMSVVALEAGENWNSEDFPADEIAASGLYWLGERLSAGETPEAFGANNSGTGVGGSTLHWGAFVPRVDPRDLKLHSEAGVGADWPIDYADLLPYYDEVEQFIGVSGPKSYPWDSNRHYLLAPVPRNAPAQMMQIACDTLGIRATDAPAAVLSQDRCSLEGPFRHACISCGYCHQGCRIGAKTSMDVTYLPQALAAGAEIRPNSFVHGMEQDASGHIHSVVYRHQGADHRQKCRAVFLCAGAVETPRLLLHLGIANASGQVGRNYMAHVATQVWGSFDCDMRPNKGYPSSLITEDFIRVPDADFAGGYLVQSLGVVPATWAGLVARAGGLWGQGLVDAINGYNHLAGIGINGECLPQPQNFLELSAEVDEHGMQKPLIHYSYGPNERAIDRHAVAFMTRAWQAAGASDIRSLQRSAHTIGTCRMGSEAAGSVVDHAGKSHEIPNLWICDNSIFPSALTANPALTIMALSLRTADIVLRQR